MRTLLVISIAVAVAAIAGAGGGSGAPIQRTPPVLASYNVKATFSGSLLVSWGFKSGVAGDCTAWAEGGGISKFKASSIRPALGHLQLFTPGFTAGVGPFRRSSWANLTLLGKASGTAERSITIHASGINVPEACTSGRPRLQPSVDCGERSFPTMRAALHAVDGEFTRTLDPPDVSTELSGLNTDLIRFTILAGREPFSSCGIPPYAEKPHYAPTFIFERSLRVKDRHWNALRTLRRGQSHRVTDHYGGQCTKDIPAETAPSSLISS